MTRVLVKGPETALEDVHSDWDEEENLIDSNLVFYDLKHLQHRSQNVAYPTFDPLGSGEDEKKPLQLPSKDDVINYLFGGNDVVIRLPTTPTFRLEGRDNHGEERWYEFDPFAWLPIGVGLDDENGGDLIESRDGWEWYFDDDFRWETVLNVTQGIRGPGYSDPKPYIKDGEEVNIKSLGDPRRARYPVPNIEILAKNNVDDPLAAKVQLRKKVTKGNLKESEGWIYLLPPHDSFDSGEFVRGVLEHEFGLDVEHKPGWIDDYAVPGEDDFQDRLESLESELAGLEADLQEAKEYRTLLFEGDDKLEELVPEVLRKMGLEVDGEISGDRDGAIKLEDETLILEITGQNDGVGHGKIRQLEDHLESAERDGYGTNRTGLLIFNHFKNREPSDRELNPSGFKDRLEREGCKLLTAVDLYEIYCAYTRGEVETDDIEDLLTSDDTIIRINSEVSGSTSRTDNRLSSIRERLGQIL